MAEFDYTTERCIYCDGHWRHYCPCPYVDQNFSRCASYGRPGHTCERSAEPGPDEHPGLDLAEQREIDAEAAAARYDDDPNPYEGTYSED